MPHVFLALAVAVTLTSVATGQERVFPAHPAASRSPEVDSALKITDSAVDLAGGGGVVSFRPAGGREEPPTWKSSRPGASEEFGDALWMDSSILGVAPDDARLYGSRTPTTVELRPVVCPASAEHDSGNVFPGGRTLTQRVSLASTCFYLPSRSFGYSYAFAGNALASFDLSGRASRALLGTLLSTPAFSPSTHWFGGLPWSGFGLSLRGSGGAGGAGSFRLRRNRSASSGSPAISNTMSAGHYSNPTQGTDWVEWDPAQGEAEQTPPDEGDGMDPSSRWRIYEGFTGGPIRSSTGLGSGNLSGHSDRILGALGLPRPAASSHATAPGFYSKDREFGYSFTFQDGD